MGILRCFESCLQFCDVDGRRAAAAAAIRSHEEGFGRILVQTEVWPGLHCDDQGAAVRPRAVPAQEATVLSRLVSGQFCWHGALVVPSRTTATGRAFVNYC